MTQSRKMFQVALLCGLLVGSAAAAQRHENHPGGPPPPNSATTPGCCASMGNPPTPSTPSMESHSMMDMGSCPHMQAAAMADQLLSSFAEMEKEQDMVALRLKLAAHGNLLKQLKSTTAQKCPMMEKMGGPMGSPMGSMMGGMQHDASAK